MHSIRVPVEDLTGERLDTGFYSPEFFLSRNILDASGLRYFPLGNVCDPWQFGAYALCNEIEWCSKDIGVPYLKAESLGSPLLDIEGLKYVTQRTHELLTKSQLDAGDLIVATSGTIGPCAVLPESIPYANSNQDTIKFNPSMAGFDNYFVGAWFTTRYLQAFLKKEGGGAVQQHIYLFNFKRLPLLDIARVAQKYIGNKIRQAEQLRQFVDNITREVTIFNSKFIPDQKGLDYNEKTRRVKNNQMTERLDAHFYPSAVEKYLSKQSTQAIPVGKLAKSVFNGQTQPEIEVHAIRQITVANLSSNFIIGEYRWVNPPKKNTKFLKQHDLLLCNAAHSKSYIGREITYFYSENSILPSTEVMVIRVDRNILPASYLRSYLLTKIGYIQIQSTIRGITAHTYPSDVKLLEIPIPKLTDEDRNRWFGCDEKMVRAGIAHDTAMLLTKTAIQLTEALIENKLTENDLITAQNALENGDAAPDREILKSITENGYGEKGAPLFPDIDELYALIEEAEASMEAT